MNDSCVVIIDYGEMALHAEISYELIPEEPRVMYDRDGGGYPGSPPDAHLRFVEAIAWYDGETLTQRPAELPAWWQMLDLVATDSVEERWDSEYRLVCLEDAQMKDEAAKEQSASDRRFRNE